MSWYRFAWPDESWHFAIDGHGLTLCGMFQVTPSASLATVERFVEARAAGGAICRECKARRQDQYWAREADESLDALDEAIKKHARP